MIGSVAATLGGIAAPIQFAGAAPRIPGLYQLNIQVPQNTPSGNQQLFIYLNRKSSKPGVTVEIE